MSLQKEGLSLFEAARAVGVSFSQEVEPQSREVDAKGLTLHYLDWGNEDKQPLLYLHGALQQAHTWDFVALPLCADYHVMALDTRGHGDSQWAPDGDYSLDAHQRDLDAFVEAVGLDQFILVGHSMGGRNAYVYTSRHPEKVKALVIVDTGPQIRSQGEGRIRGFRELIDELDTYQEFADRIQQYTGRTRDQVMGALKYNIRQRSDGKWTWKYDKLLRTPGNRPEAGLWRSCGSVWPASNAPPSSSGAARATSSPARPWRDAEGYTRQHRRYGPKGGPPGSGRQPRDFLEAFQTLLDRI